MQGKEESWLFHAGAHDRHSYAADMLESVRQHMMHVVVLQILMVNDIVLMLNIHHKHAMGCAHTIMFRKQ